MNKHHLPVGRVSPSGVTRQAIMEASSAENVGLRCANPTYAAEIMAKYAVIQPAAGRVGK